MNAVPASSPSIARSARSQGRANHEATSAAIAPVGGARGRGPGARRRRLEGAGRCLRRRTGTLRVCAARMRWLRSSCARKSSDSAVRPPEWSSPRARAAVARRDACNATAGCAVERAKGTSWRASRKSEPMLAHPTRFCGPCRSPQAPKRRLGRKSPMRKVASRGRHCHAHRPRGALGRRDSAPPTEAER